MNRPGLLTYKEVAKILNVTVEKVMSYSKKDLPRVRLGHKSPRIDPWDLEKFIRKRKDECA